MGLAEDDPLAGLGEDALRSEVVRMRTLNEGLEDENRRLLVANKEAKTARLEHYEGWLGEQKETILELTRRLGLQEAEARYYGTQPETSEAIRAEVVALLEEAVERPISRPKALHGQLLVNTLVSRISFTLPPANG